MNNFNPRLHAGTPNVSVATSTGALIITLRVLRYPDEPDAMRILSTRSVIEVPGRTLRQYGSRLLRQADGEIRPDAITVTALSGQTTLLHTADGDTALSLADAAGRCLWTRNAQGTLNIFGYDSASSGGRLLSITETAANAPSRIRDRFEYGDANNAEVRHCNLAGAIVHQYNNAGNMRVYSISLTGHHRLTKQCLLPPDIQQVNWSSFNIPNMEPPLVVNATFDSTGAPLTQTNAAGATTATAYDVSGAVKETRLYLAKRASLNLTNLRRRADGVILSQTNGNGIIDEYEYDPQTLRLTRHITQRPDSHLLRAFLISDLHYTYDPAGNILGMEDKEAQSTWHRGRQSGGMRHYIYDTLSRLIGATGRERTPAAHYQTQPTRQMDSTAGRVWKPYAEHYLYDDGNNLISIRHQGGSGDYTRELTVADNSNRALLQESDQIPEMSFLPGGLQTKLTDGRTLSWYADGQLLGICQIRRKETEDDSEIYHYANAATRVRKVTKTKSIGGLSISVTTYAGGCETRQRVLHGNKYYTTQLDVRITEVENMRVVEDRRNSEVHLRYGFSDHLGSTSGETDDRGRLTSREEYLPYGGTAGSDEEARELTDRTRRYSGKERDITGLYYYGWRYYQPDSGRWLNADPAGLIDGCNLFSFCSNNPMLVIDRDGRVGDSVQPSGSSQNRRMERQETTHHVLVPEATFQAPHTKLNIAKETLLNTIPVVGAYRRYKAGDKEGLKNTLLADMAMLVPILGIPLKILSAAKLAEKMLNEKKSVEPKSISTDKIIKYADNFLNMTNKSWTERTKHKEESLFDAEARRAFNREILIDDLKQNPLLSSINTLNALEGSFGFRLRGVTDFVAEKVGFNSQDLLQISNTAKYTAVLDDMVTTLRVIHEKQEVRFEPPMLITDITELTSEEIAAFEKIGIPHTMLY